MICKIRLNNLPERTWYGLSSVAHYWTHLIPVQWLTRWQFHFSFKLNLTLKYQFKRVLTQLFLPQWVATLFSMNTLCQKQLTLHTVPQHATAIHYDAHPWKNNTHQPSVM
jgi:hypothetical protein